MVKKRGNICRLGSKNPKCKKTSRKRTKKRTPQNKWAWV